MPLFRARSQREMERRVWKLAQRGKVGELQTELLKDRQLANAFHADKGTTPLMIACKRGHAEAVRVLLEHGAQVNLKDRAKRGNTALHIATYYNSNTAVELLLSNGADVFALNQRGHMPLDLARFRNHRSVVEMISAHCLVRKGWLHCRRVSGLGLVWKHRWCVVLAANRERTALDLYILKSNDDVRPMYVVQLSAGCHAVRVPFKVWIDRSNMFELDQSSKFQSFSAKEFSRMEQRNPPRSSDSFRFATDSESDRDSWIAALSFSPGALRSSSSNSWPIAPTGSFVEESSHLPAHSDILEEQLFPTPSPQPVCSGSPPPALPSPMYPLPSAPEARESDFGIDALSVIAQSLAVHETAWQPATSRVLKNSATLSPIKTRGDCVICMNAEKDAICIPCGHLAGCYNCLQSIKLQSVCPICRAKIERVNKVYEC